MKNSVTQEWTLGRRRGRPSRRKRRQMWALRILDTKGHRRQTVKRRR